MTDNDVSFWLSLMAIASVVQVALLLAAVVIGFFAARAMRAKVDEIHRQQLTPLVARAHHVIDEAQEAVRKARVVTDEVRGVVSRAGDRVQHVTSVVRAKASPIVGLVRGAQAAISALANGRPNGRPLADRDESAETRDQEARFTNEGGTHHARS
jgi:hypothetical protein